MSNIKKILARCRKRYQKIKDFLVKHLKIYTNILGIAFIFIKKNARYFEALILFLLVFSGILIVYSYRDSYDFYKSQVDQFIAPPIVVDGKMYKVANDEIYINGNRLNPSASNFFLRLKILRLSFFTIQARIDPLFGVEGQDLEKLRHSIDLLQNSTDGLSNSKNFKDINFVRDNILPISFLKQLEKIEDLRRTVASNPTEGIIKVYNDELAKTIDNYSDSLENLKKIFSIAQNVQPKYKNASIEFIGGSTKFSDYLDIINALKENASDKFNQYKTRSACLNGRWQRCDSLKKTIYNSLESIKNNQSYIQYTGGSLKTNSDYKAQLDIINKFLVQNSDKYISEDKTFIGLHTNCFQQQNYSFFSMSWLKYKQENIFKPRFINNLFFLDLSKDTEPIFDVLRARGDQYDWQQETNYYLCPDLSYLGELDSLYEIRNLLKNRMISINNIDSDIGNFYNAEKNIINKDTLTEEDFHKFIYESLNLLEKHPETELSKKIGEDNVLFIEKLINIYKQNSSGLSDLITAGWQQNETWAENISNDASKQEFEDNLPYFVLRRSAPSIYFLTYNQSIIGNRPDFFSKVQLSSRKYEDLFSIDLDTPQEIINTMEDSNLLPSLNLKKQQENK